MDKKFYSKKELSAIYKKVDILKFLDHYHARMVASHGDELNFCCILPGHKDSSPSASFNVKKGLYNCFVCGGKTIFNLVKELENLPSFSAAVEFIKKQVGYNSQTNEIDLLLDEANELREDVDSADEKPQYTEINLNSYPEFEPAFDHFLKVKKRVSKRMIDFWGLKYAISGYYKDRLIIPITMYSKVYSFAARDMSGRSAKWLKILTQAKKDRITTVDLIELRDKYECKKIIYPPVLEPGEEKKNIIYGSYTKFLLFNYDNAIKQSNYVILVEGVFDAMRLHMLGYNVVALLGTKLSQHKKTLLLSRFDKIYTALDNDVIEGKDNAGQIAAEKILKSFNGEVEAYNILLPPNKDPDECDEEEFRQYFNQATKY